MDEFIEEEREEVNDPLENEGEDAHNDAEEANDDEVVNDDFTQLFAYCSQIVFNMPIQSFD